MLFIFFFLNNYDVLYRTSQCIEDVYIRVHKLVIMSVCLHDIVSERKGRFQEFISFKVRKIETRPKHLWIKEHLKILYST